MGLSDSQKRAMSYVDGVLQGIPVKHVDALFDEADRWYSYKLMSLHSALSDVSLPGDCVELGVYRGRCGRFLASLLDGDRRLYLLDSFEGLPEDWVGPWKKGAFGLAPEEVPVFEQSNVEVIPGWFADTIPELLRRLKRPLALIHVDADLYSSTIDALNALNPAIVPGTVILFDEYVMQIDGEFSDDEHRALLDWSAAHGRTFEYLWRTEWVQVAVRITA